MSLADLNAKMSKKEMGQVARAHELSPSAQAIKIHKALKSLLDVLGEDDIDRVAAVYRECMEATQRFWIDKGKDQNGRAKGYWEFRPDFKTRLAAANMVAAYKEGLPVQRQIQLQGKFTDLGEVLAQVRESPETMKMLAQLGQPVIDVESDPA